jgi:hypothetical protein
VSSADVFLIDLASPARLFHATDGTAFADLVIDGNRPTWPVRGTPLSPRRRASAEIPDPNYEERKDHNPVLISLSLGIILLHTFYRKRFPWRKPSPAQGLLQTKLPSSQKQLSKQLRDWA